MTRIESLLNSSFFKNPKMREALKKLMQTSLRCLHTEDIEITDLPLSILIPDDIFNDEICLVVRDSKFYINFEHDAADKKLQKLIFMSLIFSYTEFPDDQSWINFLNSDEANKKAQIFDGIVKLWTDIQRRQIRSELDEDLSDIQEYDLPF